MSSIKPSFFVRAAEAELSEENGSFARTRGASFITVSCVSHTAQMDPPGLCAAVAHAQDLFVSVMKIFLRMFLPSQSPTVLCIAVNVVMASFRSPLVVPKITEMKEDALEKLENYD